MRFAKYLLLLMIIPMMTLVAQDEDLDNLPFDEEPLREISRPYFVLGGGFTTNILMPKMDALNDLAKKLDLGEFPGTMLQYGGQGMTGIPQLENFRFGFFAQGGMLNVSEDFPLVSIGEPLTVNRNLDVAISTAGFNIGYGYVPIKSLAIIPEIGFGWGEFSIESYQAYTSGKDYNFGEDFPNNTDANTYMKRASSSFNYVQPALNIEYAVTEFLMVRANVNYTYGFSWDWKMNGVGPIKDFKTDDINANGLGVQLGIFLGLFNY